MWPKLDVLHLSAAFNVPSSSRLSDKVHVATYIQLAKDNDMVRPNIEAISRGYSRFCI